MTNDNYNFVQLKCGAYKRINDQHYFAGKPRVCLI